MSATATAKMEEDVMVVATTVVVENVMLVSVG